MFLVQVVDVRERLTRTNDDPHKRCVESSMTGSSVRFPQMCSMLGAGNEGVSRRLIGDDSWTHGWYPDWQQRLVLSDVLHVGSR